MSGRLRDFAGSLLVEWDGFARPPHQHGSKQDMQQHLECLGMRSHKPGGFQDECTGSTAKAVGYVGTRSQMTLHMNETHPESQIETGNSQGE